MAKKTAHPGHGTHHVSVPKNYCFGCGRDNPEGMRLKFYFDEERKRFVCRFRLGRRFTGPPKHAHGGIIAAILDEAMGKVNKLRNVIALTRGMEVHYLRPVPLHKPLVVEAHEIRVEGRKHINKAEILNQQGEVLSWSQGTFIAIDPHAIFGNLFRRAAPSADEPKGRRKRQRRS